MKKNGTLHLIASILLIVGGLNWGLIGLFGWDLVGSVFGEMSTFTRVIYVVVGISAIYRLALWFQAKSSK